MCCRANSWRPVFSFSSRPPLMGQLYSCSPDMTKRSPSFQLVKRYMFAFIILPFLVNKRSLNNGTKWIISPHNMNFPGPAGLSSAWFSLELNMRLWSKIMCPNNLWVKLHISFRGWVKSTVYKDSWCGFSLLGCLHLLISYNILDIIRYYFRYL